MKKPTIFGLFCLLIVFIVACHVDTTTSFGLNIRKAIFAKKDNSGKMVVVPNKTFNRGDTIYYVLLHVSKFKKGEDGLNLFDMDMQVKGPKGNLLLKKKRLLGKAGHVALKDGIAASPHGIFKTTGYMKPGRYKIELTIYDKIGKGSASKGATFLLK